MSVRSFPSSPRTVILVLTIGLLSSAGVLAEVPVAENVPSKATLTGQAAFTDALHESPGVRRHVTAADLPAPKPAESVDNGANMVARPEGAWPKAPAGFKVELYATGLDNPRLIRTAPNLSLIHI